MYGREKEWSVYDRVLEKGRRYDPTSENLEAVVLHTIFILLALRGSHFTTVVSTALGLYKFFSRNRISSTKKPIFVDGHIRKRVPSIKQGLFVDGKSEWCAQKLASKAIENIVP